MLHWVWPLVQIVQTLSTHVLLPVHALVQLQQGQGHRQGHGPQGLTPLGGMTHVGYVGTVGELTSFGDYVGR